jgi:protein gp37
MLSDAYWTQPLTWNAEANKTATRARVFCASMADVFENRDDLDAPRARLWKLIGETPHLDWLLLTKRPQHIGRLVPWGERWPPNVWVGTTIETQRWAERRVPMLMQFPAVVRFVSCEPLLGALDISRWLMPNREGRAINWVITGGESGYRARPMNPAWARALRDQCEAHGIGFHFKQWGNWCPSHGQPDGYRSRTLNDGTAAGVLMVNAGKKESGRLLDGREWNGLPELAAA